MTPLQKIAMGLVIVVIPADFGSTCRAYDALPDPIGWLLVLWGLRALGTTLDVDWARWAAVVSFLVSVPLWFPQLNQALIPDCGGVGGASLDSLRWGVSVPTFVFGLALSRAIGQAALAQDPRDRFVAGRFGVLTWGFALCAVLPAISYATDDRGAAAGTDPDPAVIGPLVLVGVVQIVFVYYLFRVHRRTWLGGPGPLEIHPEDVAAPTPPEPGAPARRGRRNARQNTRQAAPDEPERPA